jgi:hypothetical protein
MLAGIAEPWTPLQFEPDGCRRRTGIGCSAFSAGGRVPDGESGTIRDRSRLKKIIIDGRAIATGEDRCNRIVTLREIDHWPCHRRREAPRSRIGVGVSEDTVMIIRIGNKTGGN